MIADMIAAFNLTSRYLDDLLNYINNIHVEQMVHRIYPAELHLNKANASDTKAAFLANPNFSYLFKRIVNRFQRAEYSLDIMRQAACLVLTQSWLKVMLHSLVARRWFRPQTQ